jgi:peptidoglycan endopeptidase LytF
MSNVKAFLNARQVFRVSVANEGTRNRYDISYPRPTGGVGTATFRDNVPSSFTVYKEGISYAGTPTASIDRLPPQAFAAAGLNATLTKALRLVSSHEAKFDGINSYDKAIFSFGFIQFAGGSVSAGQLPNMMMLFKTKQPQMFQQLFGQYGIDVVAGSPRPDVRIWTENGSQVGGDDAWMYVMRNKQLTTTFIAAGNSPICMAIQIEQAAVGYVFPALKMPLDLGALGRVPASSILRSEAGNIALIDRTINMGAGGASRLFKEAIDTLAPGASLAQVQGLSDQRILQQVVAIGQSRNDKRITDRINSIINGGYSFAK